MWYVPTQYDEKWVNLDTRFCWQDVRWEKLVGRLALHAAQQPKKPQWITQRKHRRSLGETVRAYLKTCNDEKALLGMQVEMWVNDGPQGKLCNTQSVFFVEFWNASVAPSFLKILGFSTHSNMFQYYLQKLFSYHSNRTLSHPLKCPCSILGIWEYVMVTW